MLVFCLLALFADPVEFYKTRVLPLLVKECFACHTGARMGGLRLDSREGIVKGGNSGPAIVPGRPEASLLLGALSHTGKLKMPPQRKLPESQIADLREWIAAGAHFDVAGAVPAVPVASRDHWAFQPVRKPAPPEVRNSAWPRSAIDRFVLAGLEERGLAPAPPAGERVLLRRISYDLTGLPPAPGAGEPYEAVVDRLLAGPRFGERWGRHWLDVARYSDEDALGLDADPFPNAWRYRDWVIRAFNRDMPYDRFVKAQIAGDLLEPPSATELKPGLGLFGLGPWYYKIVEPPRARADELHDRVDVLGRGFLGLTLACARCHDHKYDPITANDYYALAGVFNSTEYKEYPLVAPAVSKTWHGRKKKIEDTEAAIKKLLDGERRRVAEDFAHRAASYLKGEGPLEPLLVARWKTYAGAAREHPYPLDAPQKFQALLDELIREHREIEAYNERVLEEAKKSTDPYDLFCKGCTAETRTLARDKYVLWTDLFGAKQRSNEKQPGVLYFDDKAIERFLGPEPKARLAALRLELKALKKALPPRYPFLHVIADAEKPGDMRRHMRGDPYNLGQPVARAFPAVLGGRPFKHASGRMELAEAVASPDNPLTARVMVNRVWSHLFGAGLVRTPSNFGVAGDRPSHPELLDYLAARFVENGWSVKALIREIVLSSTYRMSSEFSGKGYAIDPENRLLWRANRRRLDAEALRDSLLFVTGKLDLMPGGPPVKWNARNVRRTVYGKVSRFRMERMLTLFDFPSPTMHAEQRTETNTPLQRLFFLNSDLVVSQARTLAARTAGQKPRARIPALYRAVLGRSPDAAEVRAGLEFVRQERDWVLYAQALLSSNEFQFVD